MFSCYSNIFSKKALIDRTVIISLSDALVFQFMVGKPMYLGSYNYIIWFAYHLTERYGEISSIKTFIENINTFCRRVFPRKLWIHEASR